MLGWRAKVDDEGVVVPRQGRPNVIDRQRARVRHAATQQSGPGLVHRAHPCEVAGKRGLAGEEDPGELVDLGGSEHRVVATFEADRRGRGRGNPGRAERARAVGRVHAHEVLVGQDDIVDGVEHLPRERHRVGLAEEVRPPDRADEQRAAGEQEQRLGGPVHVGHGKGDVLRRVAGGLEDREPQGAHVEGLAVMHRPVLVGKLRAGADHVAGAGQRGQLAAAGDVIVVEVRLDDVADPDIGGACSVKVDVDVATRVDDRSQAGRLVGDQRREVAETIDDELAQEHRGERTSARVGPSGCPSRFDRHVGRRASNPDPVLDSGEPPGGSAGV